MLRLTHRLRIPISNTMLLRSASGQAPNSDNSVLSASVEHDSKKKQFQYLGGHLDYETYLETVNGQDVSVLDLTHTFVPPSGRGKGIAKILCDAAFEFARLEGVAIRPSCSYLTDTYLVKNDPGTVQIV